MKKVLFVILTCFLCLASNVKAQSFKIIGYMPSWSGSATNIQYSKLTHINYAFVEPNTDGSGALLAMPNPSKLTSIVSYAHAANVKVFISIGGYGDGDDTEWRTLASSGTSIATFRNQAMDIVWAYNLDGIDIDWEFPSNSTESTGFINLMTSLSDTLHKVNKYLSAAVVAQGNTATYISPMTFDYVDWFNIMAYDNCCSVAHSSYSYGVNSLDYWIASFLPPEKAMMGVPFYGKSLNGGNSTAYSTIIAANTANSQSDIYTNSSSIDIYYNGIPTIKSKTSYAKANGGGIMIWELSEDASGANIAYSLLSAINQVQPAIQEVTAVKTTETFSTSLYPNPAKDYVYIEATDVKVASFQYNVVDLSGKSMLSGVINSNAGQVPLSSIPQGMYVLHLKEGDKVSAIRLVKE